MLKKTEDSGNISVEVKTTPPISVTPGQIRLWPGEQGEASLCEKTLSRHLTWVWSRFWKQFASLFWGRLIFNFNFENFLFVFCQNEGEWNRFHEAKTRCSWANQSAVSNYQFNVSIVPRLPFFLSLSQNQCLCTVVSSLAPVFQCVADLILYGLTPILVYQSISDP